MTQEEFHKRYQYNPNTDCLGEGGFGKVYKAFDTHRDRYVAIKMAEVKPHLEEVRLRKEVETISKLPTHPNVAYYEECYTFFTFAGEYDFGVLQYYELGNLEQLLLAKQLTNEQKDSILRQILQGIEFLHSQGIIHRDLKPQNILVVDRNGEYIPKITDFGISKKFDINKSSVFTNSLAGAGTLSFASPEQLLGKTIKKNTDLWSFGIIACWMFTGKLPFTTGNQTVTSEAGRIELFKQITAGDVSAFISQLPTVWGKLVKQCIVVDVNKRAVGADICSVMANGKVNVLKNITKETVISESKITTSNLKETKVYVDESSLPLLSANEYFKRGKKKYEESKFESAILDFNDAIRLNPSDSNNYFFKAICEYQKGNYKVSINDITKAIELHPKNYNAYFNRALCYEKLNNAEQACKDYYNAYQLNSSEEFFDNWIEMAVASNNLMTLDKFLSNTKWSKRDRVFYARGKVFEKKNDSEKACEDYFNAYLLNSSEKNFDSWIVMAILSHNLLTLGNYLSNTKWPKRDRVFYARGNVYESKKYYEKACEDYYNAYQIKADKKYINALVKTLSTIEDENLFETYIEKNPQIKDRIYFERGIFILKRKGANNKKKAIDYIYSAYQINKKAGYENLIFSEIEKPDIEILNLYLEKDFPDNGSLFYKRALLHMNLGHRKQTLADIKKSKELGCSDAALAFKEIYATKTILFYSILNTVFFISLFIVLINYFYSDDVNMIAIFMFIFWLLGVMFYGSHGDAHISANIFCKTMPNSTKILLFFNYSK